MAVLSTVRQKLSLFALAGALLLPGGPTIAFAQTSPWPKPPVVGCNGASIQLPAEVDDGEDQDDPYEATTVDEQSPMVAGSIKAPPRVREGDEKSLLKLAKVSRDEALKIALDEIGNPPERKVRLVVLEVENGYVVWTIKTELRDPKAGPDPKLNIAIDAGTGQPLLIECDPQDN